METELSAILLEHAAVITRMNNCGLALKWLKEYSAPCLLACCGRMEKALPGINATDTAIQRELIENRDFASWYADLLPLFPEEDPPPEPKPAPSYSAYRSRNSRYQPPVRQGPPSRRMVFQNALREFLETCNSNGKDITGCDQDELAGLLMQEPFTSYTRLVFLENFIPSALPESIKRNTIASLQNCVDLPLELNERQQDLLAQPFTATRHMFCSAPFPEICKLLDTHPELVDIIRLLHNYQVQEELNIADYSNIAQSVSDHHQLLTSLLSRVGSIVTGMFIRFWKKSGCPLHELRTIEAQAREHPELNWSDRLSTYAGYVNQLYDSRFRYIDLASVSTYQEDILIYAIVNSKRHFIRLVDAHAEEFLDLPSTSVLFQEKIYREHFNLNELTESGLKDCAWMTARRLNAESLSPERRYTFPELKALYDAPSQYITLYHALTSDSQDYRLKVFRQLLKRRALPGSMSEGETAALASCLCVKPLDAWMQTDFGHIPGLTASVAVQLLAHLDKMGHILPSIQNETEASLALRNLDALEQYPSMEELKENLIQTDPDWRTLAEKMDLSHAFQTQHREGIIRFLCNNGAYIAWTYQRGLSEGQRAAYFRVVKAELMGKLDELKYYEGDLQRELDSPLTARVRAGWRVNLHMKKGGLEVREHDDFFSTMLLGNRPQRTCLSYVDGAYKQCLLSAFDSNKKILYATLDGRVVGRAFLRLTKGRLTGADTPGETEPGGFTFVDLENVKSSRPEQSRGQEGLTIFLERPYISGVGPVEKQDIMRMFVELSERKADELDTMLILSADYRGAHLSGFTWTRYAVYISKSKAGAQYLDSLGGQAAVDSERSYSSSNFLVREPGALPLAM